MEPITALAALAPLVTDAGKALINRFIAADFKPKTVDEWARMRDADAKMFELMNNAGGANPSYPWVEAIVRLQRPAVAAVALGVWAWTQVQGIPSPTVDNFAAAVGFYLFGDRTLFYVRKAAGK
jgi:hypothetical protein